MLFVLSSDAEKTVNSVILWFNYRNVRVVRKKKLSIEDIFSIKDENLLSEICSFWNRKGDIGGYIFKINNTKIQNYISDEFDVFIGYFIKRLQQKKHLGNYYLQVPNKLNHLSIAQEVGLEIPDMLITTQKSILLGFKNKYKSIINKSLKDSFTGSFDGIYYYNHTERVSDEVIESLDETFFPSLFQEELEKAYELRIVFVNDVLWTMAIFSQNDEKTSVDWRNYNHERPNRKTPYQLPQQVADNTRKFIKASGLNIGAIDMVVTKDRKFVFLECNPNGQISMTSESCNYFIEKHIAEYLSTP